MVDLMVSEQQSGTAGKDVPAGFKLTEVGVIPQDWEVKTIGQLNPFITSGSRGWADFYVDYGDLFVRITNMSRNSIYLDTKTSENKFVSLPATSTEGKRTQLNNGDVLISITADIGIIGYIDESIAKPAYINQHISLVRFDDDSIDNKFVAYFLASENVQKKFLANSDVGAKAGMNLNGVRSIIFSVPTIQEQSAIAEALTDVDTLIVELKKVLAKKKAIKIATMQQLLTGKTRLPQFALRDDGAAKGYKKSETGNIPEDWYTSTILDIVTHIIDYRGRTPKKLGMDWGNGNIVALSAGNVKKGYIDFSSECYFGSDELYNRWMTSGTPKRNDIVFTMEAPLGNAALIPDDKKYILSQRTILLQINEERFTPFFILQVLLSDFFQSYIYDCATGSTAQGIKRSIFEKLYIASPKNREEQTAIATILSDMDKDIQTLQQRLDKTRQLKQGMMQELLTGKTRLIKRN